MLHWFGLVWLQRCNAKAEEQLSELYHTEEPRSDPAMGSETAKIKSERHSPWAAFFYPFLLHCPWNVWDEGRQAAFLGTTGMKKLEYPHAPCLGRQLIPTQKCCSSGGIFQGLGTCPGPLGPAGPHSWSLGTASLWGRKGHELLPARKCFKRSKRNARETSHEGSHELSAGSSSKEHLQCSPQPGAQGCAAKMKTKSPKD